MSGGESNQQQRSRTVPAAVGHQQPCAPEEAFAEAWQQHARLLLARCRLWMGGDPEDAKEAFSRATETCLLRFPQHRHRITNLKAWLLRVTYNCCMDLHRERRRQGEVSLESSLEDGQEIVPAALSSPLPSPERSFIKRELERFLTQAVAQLPDRLRAVVHGYARTDSYREVAVELGITEVTTRKRMQEARQILERRLAAYRAGEVAMSAAASRNGDRPAPPAIGQLRAAPPAARVVAMRAIRFSLDGGPEQREALIELTVRPCQLSAKRWEALERYVERHPSGWKKHLELARQHTAAGRLEQARPLLYHVIERQPHRLGPWLETIQVERLLKHRDEADELCRRARQGVRRPGEKRLLDGLLAELSGDPATAAAAYRETADLLPGDPAPWLAIARIDERAGRTCEQVAALDAALGRDGAGPGEVSDHRDSDPRDSDHRDSDHRASGDEAPDVAALALGHRALLFLGRTAEAARRDRRALEIDPGNPPALSRRLRLLSGASGASGGRRGRELLAVAERLAVNSSQARLALARHLLQRGGLAAAEELMLRAVDEHPRCRAARCATAEWLMFLGRSSDAARLLGRAGASKDEGRGDEGDWPDAESDRGAELLAIEVLVKRRRRAEVRDRIDRLLDRHPASWEAAAAAARALAELELEPGRARELSRRAVELQPALPAAWLAHGRLLTLLDARLAAPSRLAETEDSLARVMALVPRGQGCQLTIPAALQLARLLRARGERAAARDHARRALADSEAGRHGRAIASGLAWIDPLRLAYWRQQAHGELQRAG